MALKILLPQIARPWTEAHLPNDVEALWFGSVEEAVYQAPKADIAWLDDAAQAGIANAIAAATQLSWLTTMAAGVEAFPIAFLRSRGVILTNGVGLNAVAVAEHCLASMLMACKRLDIVARGNPDRMWFDDSPGKRLLQGSSALIIGQGAIGSVIAARLAAFGVTTLGVRSRSRPEDGSIGPQDWQARLGEFDWVILAAPATAGTEHMIGQAQLDTMKTAAWLVNIARGSLVDTDALVRALRDKRIGGAVLDVTSPEPLPADHPLWSEPDAIITMHLAGRAQTDMFQKGAAQFLANLDRFRTGQPLENVVDLDHGY